MYYLFITPLLENFPEDFIYLKVASLSCGLNFLGLSFGICWMRTVKRIKLWSSWLLLLLSSERISTQKLPRWLVSQVGLLPRSFPPYLPHVLCTIMFYVPKFNSSWILNMFFMSISYNFSWHSYIGALLFSSKILHIISNNWIFKYKHDLYSIPHLLNF